MACDCGREHEAGFKFYVSVKDGQRSGFLLGPYDTHDEALANVDRGRKLAYDADTRAPWYAYGTAGTELEITTVFGR
jgi:hypothetical protein